MKQYRIIITAIALLLQGGVALAQKAPEAAPAQDNFPIGIAAIVNEEVITTQDVEDRARLMLTMTEIGATEAGRKRVISQSLLMLVDETLQLQEARRQSVRANEKDIEAAMAAVEKQRGRPPGSLLKFVRENGLSERSIRRQFEAQIAWRKAVERKLRRALTLTEDEIVRAQQAALNRKGVPQVLIAAISVPIDDPKKEANAAKLAGQLSEKAQAGASFDAIAREVATRKDVVLVPATWIDEAKLEAPIAQALRQINRGEMTRPLRSRQTYQMIRLLERREIQPTSPDTEVALKRMRVAIPKNAPATEIDALMQIATQVQQNPGECGASGIAGIEGLEGLNIGVDYVRTQFKAMSPEMRNVVVPMSVGEVSLPYATKDGMELLMLCEKIEAPLPLPDRETVREQILRERAGLEAEKMLRNLKRDAFIDIRAGKKS
jgi:peptidyl-prolyl cis-trans isomerase SurA